MNFTHIVDVITSIFGVHVFLKMELEVQNRFRNVVERIFSNWSALEMSVEHCMAGSNSRQVIILYEQS